MKERYNVEIAGVSLTIISDEPEEFVNATVEKINERVSDMVVRNKRCSKLDAALLCALDYCGEYQKAERRIRNLEAQISLYDANLKRLREEAAAKGDASESVKSALGVTNDPPKSESASSPAAAPASAPATPAAPQSEKRDEAPRAPRRDAKGFEDTDTVSMLDDAPTPASPAAESADDESKRESTRSKLEQIEKLLRGSNNDE